MKERLDVLLVKRNLADSREKAKAMINEERFLAKLIGDKVLLAFLTCNSW